jgi:hypothetical protein
MGPSGPISRVDPVAFRSPLSALRSEIPCDRSVTTRVIPHEQPRSITQIREIAMKGNEASWDRIARVVLGVALIIGGLVGVKGTGGYIMAAVGLIPLVTGMVGWCPIYSIFKIGTKDDTSKVAA